MAKRDMRAASALSSAATAKKRKLATQSPFASSAARSSSHATTAPRNGDASNGDDHVAAAQRHLAQRLEQAAHTRESSRAVRVQLRRQRQRLTLVLSPTTNADHLRLRAKQQALVEMAAQLRIHLLEQQARLEPSALRRVWRRLGEMTVRAVKIKRVEWRVHFMVRSLEKIVVQASAIAERRQDTPAIANSDDKTAGSPAKNRDPVESNEREREEERAPLSVELAPHQWVPPVLWRIFEHVERALSQQRRRQSSLKNSSPQPREEFRAAMQQLMEHMRDINPYSHLHVLYRPPPPPPSGARAGDDEKWLVRQSSSVWKIADSLSHYFARLHHTAFWLESPLAKHESVSECERKFTDLISVVRNLSTHFHYVVLYLYSVAMERADLNASVSSIARQAATHSLRIDLREAYGLSPSLLVTSDVLLRQTYAYFPEVLVFLDEWRREESFRAFWFGGEKDGSGDTDVSEMTVDFARAERKEQRTLVEIAACLKDIFHAWRKSKLGTSAFEKMEISEVGALEQLVKGRLRCVVDLLYQQNVAAWVLRRQRPDRHSGRFMSELCIMSPKKPTLSDNKRSGEQQGQQQKQKTVAEHESLQHRHGVGCHSVTANHAGGVAPMEKTLACPSEPSGKSGGVPEDQAETVKMQSEKEEHQVMPAQEQENKVDSSPSTPPAAAAATPGSVAAERRRRQQHVNQHGRFRAPGVLDMNEQRNVSTKPTKAKKKTSEHPGKANGDGAGNKTPAAAVSHLKSSITKGGDDNQGGSAPASQHLEPRYRDPVLLKDIYAWTDEQIDAHEQEKEHILELQRQLATLRDKMALESAMQERLSTWFARQLPKKAKGSLALVEAWVTRVRECAIAAVCYSETIALHSAAEALIQRPSLRLDQDSLGREERASDVSASGSKVTIVIDHSDDERSDAQPKASLEAEAEPAIASEGELESLRDLRVTISASRHAIAQMLKRYDGGQSKEWHSHLVFFAQASQNLLEIAHECALPASSCCALGLEHARDVQCVDSSAA